jgi:hypothetical protein
MATKNEEEVVMCLDMFLFIKRDGNDISSLMKKRNNNSNLVFCPPSCNAMAPINCCNCSSTSFSKSVKSRIGTSSSLVLGLSVVISLFLIVVVPHTCSSTGNGQQCSPRSAGTSSDTNMSGDNKEKLGLQEGTEMLSLKSPDYA